MPALHMSSAVAGTPAELRVQRPSQVVATAGVFSANSISSGSFMVFSGGSAVLVLPAEPGKAVSQDDIDDASCPPSWFGSIHAGRTDTAARTEEILRDEFGRNDRR
jgi:hypothetical protein